MVSSQTKMMRSSITLTHSGWVLLKAPGGYLSSQSTNKYQMLFTYKSTSLASILLPLVPMNPLKKYKPMLLRRRPHWLHSFMQMLTQPWCQLHGSWHTKNSLKSLSLNRKPRPGTFTSRGLPLEGCPLFPPSLAMSFFISTPCSQSPRVQHHLKTCISSMASHTWHSTSHALQESFLGMMVNGGIIHADWYWDKGGWRRKYEGPDSKSMSNKSPNKVRVWTSYIPNIANSTTSSYKKPATRWETETETHIFPSNMELDLNCSGIRVLNCNDISITHSKLCIIWGKGDMSTVSA